MADIPVISITQVEGQSDSADDDFNDQIHSNNIHDALTDVEDLDSDEGQTRRSSYSLMNAKRKQSDGGLTDVEDYNVSDDDDDETARSDIEEKYKNTFLLQEFLDQGFVNESMHMSGFAGGQSGTRRSFRTKVPQCNIDGAITEYENIETSDDDAEIPPRPVTPGKYNDILVLSAGMNSVSISDHVSRRESIFSLATSESDEEPGPRPKSALKKPKRVKAFNVSDVENIMFTEDEADYCGAIRHSKSAFDAEEMYIESSDAEEYRSEKRVSFPEIDITFERLKPAECVLRNRKQRTVRQATGNSSLMLLIDPRDDDGHTDVENLNSSDDDDETGACRTIIPSAYVRSDQNPMTDVEDFDDGDDDGIQSDTDDGCRDIRMPSPMREITVVKEAATGARVAKVMPMLDAHFLGIEDTYLDKGLTDTEDLSGNEEDFHETIKYTIETLPDLDGGVVHNSESVRPFVRDRIKSAVACGEPITDTEDLNMGSTNTGIRRKKIKSKNVTAQKPRKFLDVKYVTNNAPVTDHEDLYMSDEAVAHHISEPVRISVSPANDGSKTDTELMSGDDGFDSNDDIITDIDPAALQQESYFSVVTSRDACSTTNKRSHFRNINRKFSPTPDMYLATHTDSEELQCVSDTDDLLTADIDSRADCVTPQALQTAVSDYGSQSSVIHDTNTSVFDMSEEANFIKGHHTLTDVPTDIEFLDEDDVGVAEEVIEDPNAIHKSAESIH